MILFGDNINFNELFKHILGSCSANGWISRHSSDATQYEPHVYSWSHGYGDADGNTTSYGSDGKHSRDAWIPRFVPSFIFTFPVALGYNLKNHTKRQEGWKGTSVEYGLTKGSKPSKRTGDS